MPGGSKRHLTTRAVACVLEKPTLTEAAQAAGIGYRTLSGWMRDPRFLRKLRRAQRAMVEHTIARLQGVGAKAVQTLEAELSGDVPSVRVRAAEVLLSQLAKAVEQRDLLERLEALEQRAQPPQRGGTPCVN